MNKKMKKTKVKVKKNNECVQIGFGEEAHKDLLKLQKRLQKDNISEVIIDCVNFVKNITKHETKDCNLLLINTNTDKVEHICSFNL